MSVTYALTCTSFLNIRLIVVDYAACFIFARGHDIGTCLGIGPLSFSFLLAQCLAHSCASQASTGRLGQLGRFTCLERTRAGTHLHIASELARNVCGACASLHVWCCAGCGVLPI